MIDVGKQSLTYIVIVLEFAMAPDKAFFYDKLCDFLLYILHIDNDLSFSQQIKFFANEIVSF